MTTKNPEIQNTPETQLKDELDTLETEIRGDENPGEEPEKKEKSFTFKPIGLSVGATTLKNGEQWVDGITTNVEFAGGAKNLNMYGYARKDWNRYAKGFNEGMELFANENLKLGKGKNFDLNGKQFYRGEGAGKLMVGPRVSTQGHIGSKVEVGGSAGGYVTRNLIPGQQNERSGDSVLDVNFNIEQKDGQNWTGYAFLDISGIKNFDTKSYGTYGEANIKTPNLLDPEKAGALCGMIYARYGGNLKKIELNCAGVGITYNF